MAEIDHPKAAVYEVPHLWLLLPVGFRLSQKWHNTKPTSNWFPIPDAKTSF
jgi:hypothetical protein